LKSRLKNKRKFAYKIRSNIDLMVPVDIIAITPSEFNKSKSKWYYVYHDIEKEGKVVYEK
jgi:hypothetical protein